MLEQEEKQFVTAEQRANFVPSEKNLELLKKLPSKPQKSLMDIKREMLQKANGQKDKPKFEINPVPAPGSANSKLPATRAVVVSETSLGNLPSAPLAKRPSRFDKTEKVETAQLTAQQLRVKQRQQKVQERMATTALNERPSIDVFKNIFSDTDTESSSNENSDSEDDERQNLTFSKPPSIEKPKAIDLDSDLIHQLMILLLSFHSLTDPL